MARSDIFSGLRRRRRGLGAVLAYALLLNALVVAVFNVQAIAAGLDPLAAAVTCDSSGSAPSDAPARHSQHQPDCTLCSPACPMGGLVQDLGNAVVAVATPPASFVLHAAVPAASRVNPRSVYLSDTFAQAPPSIG